MNYLRYISCIVLAVLSLTSCDGLVKPQRTVSPDDVLLATVENRSIYLSDISDMVTASTPEDSVLQVGAYVQSWLKRSVVLTEATEKFPPNVDIDKLVTDYRESLLLHNYRQLLIEEALDTLITAEQEQEVYEQKKDQFLLQDAICKGRIVTVPDDSRKLEKFYRDWKKNDSLAISTYAEANATFQFDTKDIWYTVDETLALLPNGTFKAKELSKKGNLQKHKGELEFFVKVTDHISQGEVAPLDYIKDSIGKMIINQRKKAILDNIEQSLYNDYLQKNRIQVFDKK